LLAARNRDVSAAEGEENEGGFEGGQDIDDWEAVVP
jgi:hypothetical protein